MAVGRHEKKYGSGACVFVDSRHWRAGREAPVWEGGSFTDGGDGWLGLICSCGGCLSAGAAMVVVKIVSGRSAGLGACPA